jgi:histidine ammonia-lyase
VHGATKDALAFMRRVLAVEINAAIASPLVFPEEDAVISAGHFHGQPVAQALNILALVALQPANISKRRMECVMDPSISDHLPAFLRPHGGLDSGLMITQMTVAVPVSENTTLSHPACAESIPRSVNREDYVRMGGLAVLKAR